MSGTIKVLLLGADSGEGTAGLRIDHEIRVMLEAIRRGSAADALELVTELAVTRREFRDALLRHDPQVVHFAGHGDGGTGLSLEDGSRMTGEELAALFTTFRDVRVVVLNACDTLPVAEALRDVVDYTVAMETGIEDEAAVDFSANFYAALAFGRTVPFAFGLARGDLEARFGVEHAIPQLLVRTGAPEGPLEGRAGKRAAARAGTADRQRNEAEGVEAKSSGTMTNVLEATAAAPVDQENRAKNMKFDGSFTMGNTATRR